MTMDPVALLKLVPCILVLPELLIFAALAVMTIYMMESKSYETDDLYEHL